MRWTAFKKTEQFGLEHQGHISHFTKKEHPTIGQFQFARFIGSLMKGAFAAAKELALKNNLGDSGAVQRHIGALATG